MENPDWRALEGRVGKRWEYYAPRFEKFARAGGVSWNWAAFFATLAWLRYRKLYAWSWAYLFVSVPVLLIALLVISAGDSCERALDPASGLAGPIVLGLIALAFIVPPLLADRLYYNHLLATAGKPGAASGFGGVAATLALQALVLVGAAVTIPSYAHYTYRAMVSGGIAEVSAAKAPFAEYVEQHNRFPAKLKDIDAAPRGRYVDRVLLEPDGTIRAVFGADSNKLSGHSVEVVPLRKANQIEWVCRSRDLPNVCLPAACRTDQNP